MLKKAVVIGDKETVIAFRMVGVKGYEVRNSEEMLSTLKKLIREAHDEIGVILLSEDFIEPIKDEVGKIQLSVSGRIVISRLPGRTPQASRLNVQDLLKKALGVG